MIIDKSEIQAKGMWKTFMKEIFNNDSCFNQLINDLYQNFSFIPSIPNKPPVCMASNLSVDLMVPFFSKSIMA